jgi:hypothetical protein
MTFEKVEGDIDRSFCAGVCAYEPAFPRNKPFFSPPPPVRDIASLTDATAAFGEFYRPQDIVAVVRGRWRLVASVDVTVRAARRALRSTFSATIRR